VKKVLIANRGEIAVRIIRACHDLGLQTVAIYSTADAEALHVLHADEAVCIGEPQSRHSYLKIPNIISACEITGADMVHPGYGFLSENSHFASICQSCGLTFIGPSAEAIALLGDKAQAKAIAREVKCPVIPGSPGIVSDLETAQAEAKRIGYPLLIKAVAGGGGRGIRFVEDPDTFAKNFSSARTEAEAAFGNPDVYLEKMIIGPRHCEVQILADTHGNVVHLGERDCTIQRRRQKLIEESPSPILTPKMRERMGEAAVAIAKRAKYSSAGTVEFLVDKDHHFYFMEVNTRIQVEHPVTEARTGIDLVKEQLRIALGEKLSVRQKDVVMEGHTIEFRINAEDPANNFAPSPCKIEYFLPPGGPGVRVDSACYAGYTIPTHYDSMVAKLIVHGKTRDEAIAIARRALREFHIGGIRSTVPFHLYMLRDPRFLQGTDYDIKYIDGLLDKGATFTSD
jgi:acetyl-CoA carboxylase, biotin carboxylase subunit